MSTLFLEFGGFMYTFKKTMTFVCIFLLSSPLYAFAEDSDNEATTKNGIIIGSGFNGLLFNDNYTGFSAENGGVFHNSGSSISISGSIIGNIATADGGGIYNLGHISSIKLTDFAQNTAQNGAALYNVGTIDNIISSFTANVATMNGAAIYNANNAKITTIQGTFSENNATEHGGAIYNDSYAIIGTIEGAFNNNTAGIVEKEDGNTDGNVENNGENLALQSIADASASSGGAIYNAGSIETIKASFTENHADTHGGAIYNEGDIENLATTFTSNTSNENGGAIYNTATIDNITNSTFEMNSSQGHGGAIYNIGSINLSASFTANTALFHGGAIYNNGVLDITNSSFEGNIASESGGAINNINTINSLVASFTANIAKNGGALLNRGIIENIENTKFIGNVAENNGGAIYNLDGTITDVEAYFAKNSASEGGAIYNNNIITNITANFENNTATFYGGAIYNTGTITNLSGSFIGNTAINSGESVEALGGAIYTTGNIAFVAEDTRNIFTNNMAGDEYNAIYVGADSVELSFTMAGTGSYTINDSIIGSTGYTIDIIGDNKDTNIFNLNNTISNLSNLEVTNTSLILGNYTHANGSSTSGAFSFESGASVEFINSHLSIDMNYIDTANALFFSDSGVTFAVDADSTLHLENVGICNITLADGFNDISVWSTDNISLSTDLLAIEQPAAGIALLSTSNSISIGINEDNELIKSAYGSIIKNALYSDDFSANAEDATTRFVYGATLDSVGSTDKRESIIYGASGIAALGGVNTSGKSAMLAGKNTIKPRYNFSSANINNGMTRLVTYNEDGSIKDEYDNVIELASSRLIRFPVVKNYSTSLWFMPMYAHESINGMSAGNNTSTYKTNIFGAAIGVDRTVRGESTDQYRIGLSGNIGMGKTSPSGDFDNISNSFDFYGGAMYGVFQRADLLFSLDIGYSMNTSELMQDLSGVSMNSTTANIETGIWHGALHVGYVYPIMGVNITPYTGVELLSIKNLDYKVEENSAQGGDIFNVVSERQNVFSIPLGVKVDTSLAIQDWAISPNASLAAIISMGDLNEYTSVSTTTSFDNAIILESQIIDKNTIDIGLGVQASKKYMKYALDINTEMSENRKVFGLSGKAEFSF